MTTFSPAGILAISAILVASLGQVTSSTEELEESSIEDEISEEVEELIELSGSDVELEVYVLEITEEVSPQEAKPTKDNIMTAVNNNFLFILILH